MVEAIDRADDPRLADYWRVGDPCWLRAQRLFVAEGRLVVRRLLDARRFRIRSILLTPAAHDALALDRLDIPTYVAPQSILNEVTGFNFHRGCLAIAGRPPDVAVSDLLSARGLVALEGVGNPDNVGGLFRVSAAFGVGGMLLDPATGDPLYRKAIRTSMGAALTLPFARDDEWPASLQACRHAGYRVLALTPRATAMALGSFELQPDEPFVLMAGAEGAGLSDDALSAADVMLRIPIAPSVDSLNVTVALAIALAALTGATRDPARP